MSLSDYKVGSAVPVSDMAKAKEFYEGKLGLTGGEEQGDGGTTYPCAEGTEIHPYPSPDNAGKSGATLAFWRVDDVDKVVDDSPPTALPSSSTTWTRSRPTRRASRSCPTATRLLSSGTRTATSWLWAPDGSLVPSASEGCRSG